MILSILITVSLAYSVAGAINESYCKLEQLKTLTNFYTDICENKKTSIKDTGCLYPKETDISEAMKKYASIFLIEGFLDIPEVMDKYQQIQIIELKDVPRNTVDKIGQMECGEKLRQRHEINEVNVCPFHYEIHYREELIPNFRKVAICNCKNCSTVVIEKIHGTKHGCKQVKKYVPILRIGYCNRTTHKYDLNLAFEEVSYACTCVQD